MIVVGGEILDLALSRVKPHSVVVMCGATSEYNRAEPRGIKVNPVILIFVIELTFLELSHDCHHANYVSSGT